MSNKLEINLPVLCRPLAGTVREKEVIIYRYLFIHLHLEVLSM